MKCDGSEGASLGAEVVDLIRAHSMVDRVIVYSFDLTSIICVKRLDPSIRTDALFEPKVSKPVSFIRRLKMVKLALDCGADEIAFHYTLVDRRVTPKAKALGLKVVVWTVDKPGWVKRAESMNIDTLITNNPARMLLERTRLGRV